MKTDHSLCDWGILLAVISAALCRVDVRGAEPLTLTHAIVQPFPAGVSRSGPWLLVSTDLIIGDGVSSYFDPEFLAEQNLMSWLDDEGTVWLSQLDAQSGALIPADGRGVMLGKGAKFINLVDPLTNVVSNGPEFGISRRGVGIYYITPGFQIARFDVGHASTEILTPGSARVLGALPSTDAHDDACRVMYARKEQSENGPRRPGEWLDETQPQVVGGFPFSKGGSSGPHWIPGSRAIITNLTDSTGVVQVARYEIDTRITTYLTSGPGDKVDAIAFAAPEYPGELLFLVITDQQWLDIYRQVENTWIRIRRITTPDARFSSDIEVKMSSAESVSYRGRTYFTYQGNDAQGNKRIGLAALKSTLNQWISQPSAARQYDPEGIVLGDQLFVYYYFNKTEGQVSELHRCAIQLWP